MSNTPESFPLKVANVVFYSGILASILTFGIEVGAKSIGVLDDINEFAESLGLEWSETSWPGEDASKQILSPGHALIGIPSTLVSIPTVWHYLYGQRK